MSADHCSFCERTNVPLVPSKHAATCLECARLAVEALAPLPNLSKILRARCPNDGDPGNAHLAFDVRLPLPMSATSAMLSALSQCPCGAEMVLKYDSTPPIGGDRG